MKKLDFATKGGTPYLKLDARAGAIKIRQGDTDVTLPLPITLEVDFDTCEIGWLGFAKDQPPSFIPGIEEPSAAAMNGIEHKLGFRIQTFVADKIGDEQICLSTSFGCERGNKYFLRLDLSRQYNSVHDLRIGRELVRLYPEHNE